MSIFNSLQHGLLSFLKPKSQGSFDDVAKKKEERVQQGLPVSVRKDRYEPTTGGSLARGLLKLPLSIATTPIPVAKQFLGNKEEKADIYAPAKSRYLGDVYSPGGKALQRIDKGTFIDPKKGLGGNVVNALKNAAYGTLDVAGKGAEAASYATGAGVLKNVATKPAAGLLKNLGRVALGEGVAGAVGGFGMGAQTVAEEEQGAKQAAGTIAKSTGAGLLGGAVLGPAAYGAGALAGKAVRTVGEGVDLYKSMTPAQRQAGFLKTPGEPSIPKYEGEKDLTTKILKDLEGKTTVSKQYILDATKRSGIKQQEIEIINKVLENEADKVNVEDFTKKVQSELLPLKVKDTVVTSKEAIVELKKLGYEFEPDMSGEPNIVDKNGDYVDYLDLPENAKRFAEVALGNAESYNDIGSPKFERVSLEEDIRGNVKNYREHVYESPISTNGSPTHFSNSEKYFGHTRIEEMASNYMSGKKVVRMIENQSDLYQKGNLKEDKYPERHHIGLTNEERSKIEKEGGSIEERNKKTKEIQDKKRKEFQKIYQYSNPTAHFRLVREEIKNYAEKGYDTMLFPTGETAMSIEGLGERSYWYDSQDFKKIEPAQDLIIGQEISNNNHQRWVVTDILSDGKFKAVPKNFLDSFIESRSVIKGREIKMDEALSMLQKETNVIEQFDISGKADTNNPIYRFYEKDLGKYLKNNYDAKLVTDEKGVTWWEADVKPEHGGAVEAFKLGAKDVTYNTTLKEAKQDLQNIFGKNVDINSVFNFKNPDMYGKVAGDTITVLEKNGNVSDLIAKHEAWHYYKGVLASNEERIQAIQLEKSIMKAFPERIAEYRANGYSEFQVAEEMVADEFARYYRTGKTISEKAKVFFDKILQRLELIFKNKTELLDYFKNIKSKDMPGRGLLDEPKFKLDKEKQSKLEELRAYKGFLEDSMKGHPGKELQRFQSRKEGSFIDTKSNDARLSAKENQRITDRNYKLKQAAEVAFAETQNTDMFDSPDTIREAIDSYQKIKQQYKDITDQIRAIRQPKEELISGQSSNIGSSRSVKRAQEKGSTYTARQSTFEPLSEEENARIANNIFGKKKTPLLAKENQIPKVRKMTRSREIASLEKLASEQASITKGEVRQSPSQSRMSEGEARSIEIQANQARDILSGEPVGGDVSLPIIIKNTITPVNKKVHFIDTYLTTPQYVMNKIGFGKEATMLRDASDALWKELPKNMERITEWAKTVPEESNKRIFRYLDGEALDLNSTESKIASEIKEWFKVWAVRLKLPKENTITHYITHIFDKELMGKEFDEDLAKIIADRIPGTVYDPFLLKRLGAKGYKQDTWAALDAYVKRATRKVHIDPVLEAIQKKTGSSADVSPLEKSVFNYIKKYVDNINMRPSEAEEGIDNFVKSMIGYKLGQRPVVGILKFLRQATFRGMLGLNPASALRNLSQGVNTYATLGEKFTIIGYSKLFKKGSSEELAREGILNAGFIQDRALSATKKAIEKADKVLFAFFDTAEHINRGAAYFGAKSQAISRGLTEEAAIKYAKSVVRKTQFVFDTVDTPVGLSGDLMKTLFQFQTYTTKQMEFLTHMAKDKNFAGLLRYALGGTAFVYTVGQLFGMEPKEILPVYRFQTPPSLKLPVEATKAVLNTPDKFGNKRTLGDKVGDVANAAVGLLPAGSQAKKTIEGISSVKQGGSFDKRGQIQFEQGQSTGAKVQSVLFGKYAGSSAKDYFKKNETQDKFDAPIEKIYKQAVKLRDAGKLDEANALTQSMTAEDYAIYKKIRAREKANETLEAEKKMVPTVQKLLKYKEEGRIDEANAITQAMTEEEFKVYKSVRDKLSKKPEFSEGETVDEKPFIEQVITYARAIGVDPATAFNRIFTGQHIKKVYNGTIVVTRLPMKESQKIKEAGNAKSADFKLDHTIPLILGGSNSEDNLKIVATADWERYTPVENYLWKQIDSGKMKKKEAQKLIKDFKNGIITFEQIKNL